MKLVKEIKDDIICRYEIKNIIREIIQEELANVRREVEELRGRMQEKNMELADLSCKKFSEVVRGNKKENTIVVKPNKMQECNDTRKIIKENIDIKNLAVGVNRIKNGNNGSLILSCESVGEIKKLKTTVQEKLGKDYQITEPKMIIYIIQS